MEIKFPLLTKDDIEIRIGQLSNDKTKASLLLYQDARCGMKYLDQVVGVANWQKRYYESKGLLICAISIWDEEKGQWIEKSDTGSAGSIEEEKSLASDSFKRCCVCWGLARELYTAPDIWVAIDSKYDKFYVSEIAYNNAREIVKLVITDKNGDIAYSYPKGAKTEKHTNSQPKQTSVANEPKPTNTSKIDLQDYILINSYLMTCSEEEAIKFNNWILTQFELNDWKDLTADQGKLVANKVKRKVANNG